MLAWRGVEDFSAVGTDTDVDVYAHTNANARDVPSSLQHDKEKRWRRRKWTRVSHQKCCERTYYSSSGSGRMYRRSRTPPMSLWRITAVSAALRLVIMIIIIDQKEKKDGVGSCGKACLLDWELRKLSGNRRHSRVCVPRLSALRRSRTCVGHHPRTHALISIITELAAVHCYYTRAPLLCSIVCKVA